MSKVTWQPRTRINMPRIRFNIWWLSLKSTTWAPVLVPKLHCAGGTRVSTFKFNRLQFWKTRPHIVYHIHWENRPSRNGNPAITEELWKSFYFFGWNHKTEEEEKIFSATAKDQYGLRMPLHVYMKNMKKQTRKTWLKSRNLENEKKVQTPRWG